MNRNKFSIAAILMMLGFTLIICAWQVFVSIADDANRILEKSPASSDISQIFDRNEAPIENSLAIAELKSAPFIWQAFVSAEDQDFFKHHGISITGMIRAFFANIFSGEYRQGGSTITQQVVKMRYLNSEKTIKRKITEIVFALALETKFTKEQILLMYLNNLYFGGGYHGIDQASLGYFGKSIKDLSLKQVAILASIIKAPSRYNLFNENGKKRAEQRSKYVLIRMVKDGYVTKEQAIRAVKAKWTTNSEDLVFTRDSLRFLRSRMSLVQNNKIHATIDIKVLKELSQKIRQLKLDHYKNLQLSAAVIKPENGEIIALQGSKNPDHSEFNRAIYTRRPVGSMVLPFVTAIALQEGFDLGLVLKGESKTIFEHFKDKNPFPLSAIVSEIGLGTFSLYWKSFGFKGDLSDFSFLLGEHAMSVIELLSSYVSLYQGSAPMGLKIIDSEKIVFRPSLLSPNVALATRDIVSKTLPGHKFKIMSKTPRNMWLVQEWQGLLLGLWIGVEGRDGVLPENLESQVSNVFGDHLRSMKPNENINLRWVPLRSENNEVFLPHFARSQNSLSIH